MAATDTYGLYNTEMWNRASGCKIQRNGSSGSYTYSVATDWANRPVNFVSYWDSCRFANWLHNGQPMGLQDASTTEHGAYALNGYNGEGGQTIGRDAGAKWAVTSEDEWYKAAYYKGGGINAGYWDYPTSSNTAPANQVLNPDPGNSANYCLNWTYTLNYPYCRTNVGEFENSASPYGTFDQCGNVWEWNEAVINGANRSIRGGSFDLTIASYQQGSFRNYTLPSSESWSVGFRVCRVAPEPSCPSADLSGDCFVNMKDFALFASAWLRHDCVTPDWCGGADFDASGAVGLKDLAELVSQWLTGER